MLQIDGGVWRYNWRSSFKFQLYLVIRFQNYADRCIRISGSATPVCSYYSRRGGPMQKTNTHCEEPVRN